MAEGMGTVEFRVSIGLGMLCRHETSTKELISCVRRWVGAGNR